MVFIGHIAHWDYEELLGLSLDEMINIHEECIKLHEKLNAQ